MRILLLTQFYWPEVRTAPVNLAAVAESLQESGNEVLVVTGFPSHPFGRVYDGYRMSWRQWEEVRGVRVLRVPLFPDHSLSMVRRAWNYSSFAVASASIGAWLTRTFRADVIFVYLPPLTICLPVSVLRLLHRAPAVFWITDLWPDGLIAAGANIKPWLARGIGLLGTAAYRQAALICVNSAGTKRRLMEKGVAEDRLEIISDWADETLFFPSEPDARLAQEFSLADRFNVMYGGNLGPAQGLDTVIEAAALLQSLPDLQFVFVGDGEDEPRLRRLVERHDLRNVRFIPRQPMEEIHRFYALADVLLIHLNPDPMYELQIPSKTMAYLACGKPILCGVSGDAAAVVEGADAGICSAPGDAVSMARAVKKLYALPASDRELLGKNGRRVYLARYTRAVQAARIESLLSMIAGTQPQGPTSSGRKT